MFRSTRVFTLTAALALTGALGLSGCGGGSREYSTAQQLADALGCTGLSVDSEEMFVKEGGGCSLNGDDISVYVFADDEARDNYLRVAQSFGGAYGKGPRWGGVW